MEGELKFAYADPPYIGQAAKFYKNHPDYAGEVDHRSLVSRLMEEFSDGWALSLSSPTLGEILAYCPKGVRVAAWCKTFCSFKVGVNPAYAWEPVIYWGGRKRGRWEPKVRDFHCSPITLGKFPGAKSAEFCFWVFNLLNIHPDDEFHDLFPGSKAVSRAWEEYRLQPKLPLTQKRPKKRDVTLWQDEPGA